MDDFTIDELIDKRYTKPVDMLDKLIFEKKLNETIEDEEDEEDEEDDEDE